VRSISHLTNYEPEEDMLQPSEFIVSWSEVPLAQKLQMASEVGVLWHSVPNFWDITLTLQLLSEWN
jgi:hypothetical protein